jgi:hypothetical protein
MLNIQQNRKKKTNNFAVQCDFLVRSASRIYFCLKQININTRVEPGSNTSTVNLRLVRGDEMGLKKAAP